MKLGLNLSFAVKRWLKPDSLANMCAKEFKVKHVQFTLDLIDPWWPDEQRGELTRAYKTAFEHHGINIESVFGGVASYSYAQLLSPTQIQRDISVQFFKRAIDLTLELGADVFGTPIGGMCYEDARDEKASAMLYASALDSLRELAAYGKERGLRQILIEATPLVTEFLYTPAAAKQMMEELDDTTDIPIRLLIDWGHALCNIIPGTKPDMLYWLQQCSPYVGGIHLQQTDGLYDRHWDFTKEGLLNAQLIREVTKAAGMEDMIQYLEVVTIFEQDDDVVLEDMKQTMRLLHEMFDTSE